MEGETQDTLAGRAGAVDGPKGVVTELAQSAKDNEKLQLQLTTAMDRVGMLEQGLEMRSTATQRIVKEDQDSIEIGAQATGRIKVYGTLGKKQEFAEKIKDAIELLEATREKMKKLDESAGE